MTISKSKTATIKLLDQYFTTAFSAPEGIPKLRELILSLAMRGQLVPQNPDDIPARDLLKDIETEKQRLIDEKKLKKSKPLPEITVDEIPYDIPDSWEWVRMDSLCMLITDGTHHTPKYTETGVPFLSVKDLSSGKINFSNTRFISLEEHNELIRRCHPEYGDVLLTKVGTTGIGVLINTKKQFSIFVSVALLKIIKGSIDAHYLTKLINSPLVKKYSSEGTEGVGNKNLVLRKIKAFIVPLPPLEEQRRIVEKIETLMEKCDRLEKLHQEKEAKKLKIQIAVGDKLLKATDKKSFDDAWQFMRDNFETIYSVKENVKQLRQIILQLAVMGKLAPQDDNDKPAQQLLKDIEAEKQRLINEKKLKIGKLTKESKNINKHILLPPSWVWVKGIDLFFTTKLAGFEYTEYMNLSDYGDIPVIRAQNVKPFRLNLENLKYIDLKTSELLERCALNKKCLLVTFIGAGIGDVALFDMDTRWHLAPNVAKMELFSNCEKLLDLRYFEYFLNSPLGKKEIFKHLKSTAQPSISMGTIRDIDYPLPPLEEQRRIVEKVDKMMKLCDELEEKITNQTEKQTCLLNALIAQI